MADPVSFLSPSNKPGKDSLLATTKLARQLSDSLLGSGGKIAQGVSSAEDLLGQEGRPDPRIANQGRSDIERTRQRMVQEAAQRFAQGGVAGTSGALAGLSHIDLGAAAAKNQLAEDEAFATQNNRTGDLATVFGDLLLNPITDLVAGRLVDNRQPAPSGLASVLGAVGRGFGAYATAKEAFGDDRNRR